MRDSAVARTIGIEAVAERLADAIQDGRLRETLTALRAPDSRLTDEAREMVVRAAAVVDAIDTAVATESARLVHELTNRGVTLGPLPVARATRPLHIVSFSVAPDLVDQATDVLTTCGYRRVAPSAPAAWRAFRATRDACNVRRV